MLILGALLAAGPAAGKGNLVIVGGGLSADNVEIYRAIIDRAKNGRIAIIPSASSEPQASLDAFAGNLVRHGVERSRIIEIRLAEVDDPATAVDEDAWAGNASRADEVAKIETASAIWFTGGDQARTMRLLVRNGKDSAMLAAIRRRLAAGAVIGGTSAGAAIMGTGMIFCGDPKRANEPVSFDPSVCAEREGRTEPLVLGRGIGFLRGHVIDQHFSERDRQPRLQRATACGAGKGIGIDENTAVIVDVAGRRATVIGKGTVTVVAKAVRIGGCTNHRFKPALAIYRAGQDFRLSR